MADYIPNDEAAFIADALIPLYHQRLVGLKISHLLKLVAPPKPKKNPKKESSKKAARVGKKVKIASASKVSAKTMALAEKDVRFVIEYISNQWDKLTDSQKIAVVDHELCHCGNDADGTYMIPHSVEEFREIIDRRGFWKDDLIQFAATVEANIHDSGPEITTEEVVAVESVEEGDPVAYVEDHE